MDTIKRSAFDGVARLKIQEVVNENTDFTT